MEELQLREVPLSATRELRRALLRPHQTLAQLAAEEPVRSYAVEVHRGDEQIAVGWVAPDGPPGAWRVRGMATAPHARGRGAGAMVLEALVRRAAEHGAGCVWCNARTPARGFYERGGFRVRSEEFELPGIGPHVVMSLRLPRTEIDQGARP